MIEGQRAMSAVDFEVTLRLVCDVTLRATSIENATGKNTGRLKFDND